MATDLIPASRFGRTLAESREAQGLSIAELAASSGGRFTTSELAFIEAGDRKVQEPRIEDLAALYDIEVEALHVGHRSHLVIDLEEGIVAAGERQAPLHVDRTGQVADEVLTQYLSLVYVMRGIEPGHDVPLRTLDVDILAQALALANDQVEARLRDMMADPSAEVQVRTRGLRNRLVIPAAGIVVAATAIGTLLFVRTSDDPLIAAPVAPVTAQIDEPLVLERATPDGPTRQVPPFNIADLTALPPTSPDVSIIEPLVFERGPNGEIIEVTPGPDATLIPPLNRDDDGDAGSGGTGAAEGEGASAPIPGIDIGDALVIVNDPDPPSFS